MDYKKYLQSPEWKERRLAKIEQSKYRCQFCKERFESHDLNVHHLNYECIGHEDSKDLIVLCRSCHWVADKLRKNPGLTLKDLLLEPRRKTPEEVKREFERRQRSYQVYLKRKAERQLRITR